MNLMNWNARFAKTVCVKSIKPRQQSSKAQDFTLQITKDQLWNYAQYAMFVTRSKITMYAKNVSTLQLRSKNTTKTYAIRNADVTCDYANVVGASGTLSARSLQGFSASPKGIACAVVAAIGISLFLPMEQVSQASIVPTKSVLKAYTRSLLTGKQYGCVSKLWGKESAWNYRADNPNSTAYGIPQILNMTTNNPWIQINLGLKYIRHRYDQPCKALAFHNNHGWY